MAIRFSCAACGGKFKTKDEYAGRRSKCPACGSAIEVPLLDAWEEDDAPPLPPPRPTPSAPRVPMAPKWPRVSEDDEPEPYRSPAKSGEAGSRPLWKQPAVAIGAAGTALVLGVFFGCLAWPHVQAYMGHNRARSQASVRAQTASASAKGELSPEADHDSDPPTGSHEAGATDREPTPEEQEHWRALVEVWVKAHITVVYRESGRWEDIEVLDAEVEAAPRDERKIPWLWVATASVAMTYKPKGPGERPTRVSITWKSLYRWSPEGPGGQSTGPRAECWRELTFMDSGKKVRDHSHLWEWKPEFRSAVASAWLRAFKEYERRLQEEAPASEYRQKVMLTAEKIKVADSLNISIDELDEILGMIQ